MEKDNSEKPKREWTPRPPMPSHKFPPNHKVTGRLRITGRGLGLVVVEGMNDPIEVEQKDLLCALHGDEVEVLLHARQMSRRPTGAITAIIFKERRTFAGVTEKRGDALFVIADDHRMYKPILIPQKDSKGAEAGQKVFAEITEWTDALLDPVGVIKEILGAPGNNDAEMKAIVLESGFMPNTDPEVIAAAEAIPDGLTAEELATRRDFRDTLTYTIDPYDAKDFDDALSIKYLPGNKYEIGVHIADVSHYVTLGSRIDEEAFERATSIYLVDRTIPMLPERLSNNLCSLIPNEDRPTFSAVFTLDEDANVVDEWYGKGVMHSVRRFTYEEAQDRIEGKVSVNGPYPAPLKMSQTPSDQVEHDCAQGILDMNRLAVKLRKMRVLAGAIEFESQEVKFKMDENGKPLEVFVKEIKDSNKMIEEFMLLANKNVAKFLADRDPRLEKNFIFRIHDYPSEERMQDLSEFLATLGVNLERSKKTGQWENRAVGRMLEEVKGRAEERMIQMASVRSMAKAIYSTQNIGHYGLGFEYYTHFTSPIRRYPDLMVHRLLQAELTGVPLPEEEIKKQEKRARYCSEMEKQAVEAERASIRLKQCEYFAERIGTAVEGTITGVTEWGIFVEDEYSKAEGLISVRDLPNDFFFYEEKKLRIVGKQTGVAFRLGDKIRAEIMKVDVKRRQIDMRLLWHPQAGDTSKHFPAPRPAPGERRPFNGNRGGFKKPFDKSQTAGNKDTQGGRGFRAGGGGFFKKPSAHAKHNTNPSQTPRPEDKENKEK